MPGSRQPKFYSLCLNARQPGKVLNGLNARQSEIFTEFLLKDSFKLLDGIRAIVHNNIKSQWSLSDCRSRSQIDNARQSEIFTEFPPKDSCKLLDGIRYIKRS